MKIRTLLSRIGLSAIFCGILGSAVFAQQIETETPPIKLENQRQVKKAHVIFMSLDLTPEQIKQIHELQKANRTALHDAILQLRQSQKLLNEAIYAPVADQNAVTQRLEEVVAAQGNLTRLQTANELSIRQLLTPDQTRKFAELRQQLVERQGEMQKSPHRLPRQRVWRVKSDNQINPKPNDKRPDLQ